MFIQLLIMNIITFAGIIFLLRYFYMQHLNTALNRLNALHEENQVKEAQLTEELKRAKEEKEAEIKRGKEAAIAAIEEAKKEAIALRLKIEEEAKGSAEKILLQAKEDAGRFKDKVSKEIEEQSLVLALEMIRETFSEENKKDLHLHFINGIIEEISKLPQEKFSAPGNNVKVFSSHPLLDGQRDNLKEVLNEKLGTPPQLEEAVNKDLIVGIILEMSGLVIDGTLKNRLRRVMPFIKKS